MEDQESKVTWKITKWKPSRYTRVDKDQTI